MKYLRSTTLECTDIGYRELLKRVHYTHIFNFNIWECKRNKETTIWLSSMSEFKLLPWIEKQWKKYRHLFFLNVSNGNFPAFSILQKPTCHCTSIWKQRCAWYFCKSNVTFCISSFTWNYIYSPFPENFQNNTLKTWK